MNLFRPFASKKESPRSDKLDLKDVIKNSYAKNPVENMNSFKLDKELSNHNQQVYYSEPHKKLIVSIAGTHRPDDFKTDFFLGAGNLKATDRYKEAENIYKKSKEKYNPMQTSVVGHSLGGSIANYITSKGDNAVGLDAGFTIGQKQRDNVKHYRTSGDVVSLLGSVHKNMTTLTNPNIRTGIGPIDWLRSHNVSNVQGRGILV